MTNLKFSLIAIVVSLALPLGAKGENDEDLAGKQNVAPDNGKGEIVAAQKQFSGPAGVIEDFGLKVVNRDVAAANEQMQDLDKEAAARAKIAAAEKLDSEHAAFTVQKDNFDARLATQNKINDTLQKIQEKRDATSQYIASHPGDTKAIDAAKQLANAYNKVAEMGNQNSDKIAMGKRFLEDHGAQNVPPAPNHVDKIRIPAAMPSELEVQQGNKPPGTTKPPTPGNKESNGNSDDQNVSSKDPLQKDIDTSSNTRDNLEALIQLATLNKLAADQNAASHPGGEGSFDDLSAKADAEGAGNDLKKLIDWHDRIQNRITDDLSKKYPAEDSNKPTDHTQNNKGNDTGDYPGGNDPIAALIGGGGLIMATNQGDANTQQFINEINGNQSGDDNGSNQGKNGSGSDQNREAARDTAKDISREATRDAANTAREHARDGADCARHGPGCH